MSAEDKQCEDLDKDLNELEELNADSDSNKINSALWRLPLLVKNLRAAIRAHRDEKLHDRCWLDDLELYKVLPEGLEGVDQQLPPEKEFLDNCKRYYDHRQNPNVVFVRQKETDIEAVLKRGYEVSKFGLIQARPLEDGTFAVDSFDITRNRIEKEEIFKTAREAAVCFTLLEKEKGLF